MGTWDQRFYVSPSQFNWQNTTFYKQFFDKPFKINQFWILKYKKTIDPYIENDIKSRIPVYSHVYCKQSWEKELNWVDNFTVKKSKDNEMMHKKFWEFFDQPKRYDYDWTVGKTKGVTKHALSIQKPKEHYKPTAFFLWPEKGNLYKLDKRAEKSVE